MTEFQDLFNSSTHCEPFHLTMSAVFGAGDGAVIGMFGCGSPPFAATSDCETTVVWLPDSKTETKTREPSLLRASARGCLPKTLIVCGADEGLAGSKTLTTPLAPVIWLKPTVCVPPPETQTKAISRLDPAKTMSVGSSPTSNR